MHLVISFVVGFIVLGTVLAQTSLPQFPGSAVSVDAGKTVYAQNCSSCHGTDANGTTTAPLDFTKASWSSSYAPAEIVNVALGQSSNHPASLTNSMSAWQATAYLWTLPLTATTFQEGQGEVNQAADLLKKGGLALLITKGGEIEDLKNTNWVMQQTEAALVKTITDVAADEYNALNTEHQQALVDYIYASHFDLPTGW